MTKALVKHGWPVKWQPHGENTFRLEHHKTGDTPPDMLNAIRICARIVARTYNVDIDVNFSSITLNREYIIRHGFFREVK